MSSILLRIIASIQLILGALFLLAPQWLLARMGHSAAPPDLVYPLGMLAARFLAYGLGLWLIARDPRGNALWIRLMAVIQVIDLTVGVVYTLAGVVPFTLSGFPMFNALWIALACSWIAHDSMKRMPHASEIHS